MIVKANVDIHVAVIAHCGQPEVSAISFSISAIIEVGKTIESLLRRPLFLPGLIQTKQLSGSH